MRENSRLSARFHFRAFSAVLAVVFSLTLAFPFSTLAGTRAKYLAFYGTNSADWVTLSAASATSPLVWKILKNPSSPAPGAAQISIFNWGVGSDSISAGSYTGDAFFDPNINRAGVNWTYPFPAGGAGIVTPWGTTGDSFGRNGDYDGDGIEDFTIRRNVGTAMNWWIRLSSGGTRVVQFGQLGPAGTSTFTFEGADFTGDGRDEIVIARVINASGATTWYIGDAVTGAQVTQAVWGNFITHYIINPADYTGDGKADFVTWAAGETLGQQKWYIMDSSTGQLVVSKNIEFGIGDPAFTNNDFPIRGDYDGDNIDDLAVWRPGTQTFYVLRSTSGALVQQQWGNPGDTPLGTFFTF